MISWLDGYMLASLNGFIVMFNYCGAKLFNQALNFQLHHKTPDGDWS